MLNRHPEAPELAVVRLIVGAELLAPRLFAAQTALWVSMCESLIAAISDHPRVRVEVGNLLFK